MFVDFILHFAKYSHVKTMSKPRNYRVRNFPISVYLYTYTNYSTHAHVSYPPCVSTSVPKDHLCLTVPSLFPLPAVLFYHPSASTIVVQTMLQYKETSGKIK